MAVSGDREQEERFSGLASMTGFAARQGNGEGWTWNVEMRSVNGRGLDLRFRLPDWVEGLEPELRKMMQGALARGNVNVAVKVQREAGAAEMRLNMAALERTLTILTEIGAAAAARGLETRLPSLAEISAIKGVVDVAEADASDTGALKAAILGTAADCLVAFREDRAREGRALSDIISGQIERVEGLVADAAAAAGDREEASRAAIARSVARLLDTTDMPDETRLIQELALIAVKNDVTEELDRLTAHVSAAREMLDQDGAVGRKFDFLMQEFNREANTLCSKSQSTTLTTIGLDLKSLIDQMREQVQNVE